MRVFLQNCPQDYNNDNKLKKSMNLQDVTSLRECVSEHKTSLLKSQPASPTCISGIADNLPGGKGSKRDAFTDTKGANEMPLPRVTWGRNKIKTFSVNNKFPMGRTLELTHGKIKNLMPRPSL